MKGIAKIKLHNFKRFKDFEVSFDPEINLIIGDNECGKTSILQAIDIVLSGSRAKIESFGLDSLFNADIVASFLSSKKAIQNLPTLMIELYLNEQHNPDLNGKNNSDGKLCDGLSLVCEPDDELSSEINEILQQPEPNFPFEYYNIVFKTFSDSSYTGYRKFFRHVMIDNSQINNEYATKEYVKAIYHSQTKESEKNKFQNEYRKHKELFKTNVLAGLNSKLDSYSFAIRNNSRANLETDLTLAENNIYIENKGKGKQCFIKTEFALMKRENKLDIVLIEEPENHLSHGNMKRLIKTISNSKGKQLFVSTHSSLVSTRLDLRKSILLNSNSSKPLLLNKLSEQTAKFFIKAPDNNLVEFILSKKVVLVEGDAEFMLMQLFFSAVMNSDPDDLGIHIISVNGTSFKRYLELAKELNIRTAVIRDNDGDYTYCMDSYSEYINDHIQVFTDHSNDRSTFEICLYNDNSQACETLFGEQRKSLSVVEFMLKNKAEAAFQFLITENKSLHVPSYIKQAIEWIAKN